MNKLINHQLLLPFLFLLGLGINTTSVFGQKAKSSTLLSFGYNYLSLVEDFSLGIHGIEASAEFLLHDEKIGIKIPVNLYYEEDLFLGSGINVKFYTNKGKLRGFLGPKYTTGRNVTDIYGDTELTGPIRYHHLTGDIGLAYNSQKMVYALSVGYGKEFKYHDNFLSIGLSVGWKL